MKIKEKLIEAKDKVYDFWYDNCEIIGLCGATMLIGVFAGCIHGMRVGAKSARSEWDFSESMYNGDGCSLLVDSGTYEPVTALPNRIIKEILDAHKRQQN